MSSSSHQLFTVEEALFRVGERKEQGCLLASKGTELVTIFAKDGFVISATAAHKNGKDAVDHALHLADATYEWIRGVQPPESANPLRISIHEFVLTNGQLHKNKATETGKMPSKKAAEGVTASQYRYFLIPENQPTNKYFLTKTATVVGRDKSADLVIEDNNMSGRHCILDIQPRGLFVLDLDSTNGTYINGVLSRDGYVNHGDILELGSYRLTINRESKKDS